MGSRLRARSPQQRREQRQRFRVGPLEGARRAGKLVGPVSVELSPMERLNAGQMTTYFIVHKMSKALPMLKKVRSVNRDRSGKHPEPYSWSIAGAPRRPRRLD